MYGLHSGAEGVSKRWQVVNEREERLAEKRARADKAGKREEWIEDCGKHSELDDCRRRHRELWTGKCVQSTSAKNCDPQYDELFQTKSRDPAGERKP